MLWEQHLWRHPPSCTPKFMTTSSGPNSRLGDDHGEPKVGQAGRAAGIYEDIDLDVIRVRVTLTPGMATHSLDVSVNNIATVQVFQPSSCADELSATVRPGYGRSWCYLQDEDGYDVGDL
jgi:hypothetical protein